MGSHIVHGDDLGSMYLIARLARYTYVGKSPVIVLFLSHWIDIIWTPNLWNLPFWIRLYSGIQNKLEGEI